jgi:hypothetical protein
MAPTFERQMSVQMEWLESKELITARGFAEFRNKTLTLYQSRIRSLPFASDERCNYRHPEFAERGRWYGVCAGGVATGRGYGIIKNVSGAWIEFVGEASKGLAQGQGAMIVHRPGLGGNTYYEGQFQAGLPHGRVRLEVPGAQPQWREFLAGKDTGRASPGEAFSFRFNESAVSALMLNP